MPRLSNFDATKDEEEIASNSNNNSRNSKSVLCDGDSAWQWLFEGDEELVEKLEASSSVELLQQAARKLDLRMTMVMERIRLLKVESIHLNQRLCGPSEEFEIWEGDFQEIDKNMQNITAIAQSSSNQQQISSPIPMVLEESSTGSNFVAADAANCMHSKRGLRFRGSFGLYLLPSVLSNGIAVDGSRTLLSSDWIKRFEISHLRITAEYK